MDSIRENITKEDMVVTIEAELNADIYGRLCVLLVEGSSDIKFAQRVFNKDVACYESFSGKGGLEELIEAPELQNHRVIAVRDKDYCDVNELPDRMFIYDTSCLELMLLKNKEVVTGIYCTYYDGSYEKEKMVQNALRKLAPCSIMRKKNEEQKLGISFKKAGFGDLIKSEEIFELDQYFERLRVSDLLAAECKAESLSVEDEQLYDITNGHDICVFLGEILKNAGKKLGEAGVRNALLSNFRKSDFMDTRLYGVIKSYQSEYGLRYVDS